MTHSTGKVTFMRGMEWIAALIGALNCLIVPLSFIQSARSGGLLPALYFIEIGLAGVLVLFFVARRTQLGARWMAVPWIAAGILLVFVILGAFSIGLFLIPALIAFLAVGVLAGVQAGGIDALHLVYGVAAAVAQTAIMLLVIQFV